MRDPDPAGVRAWRALLPERITRDAFEPALCDLRIAYLARRAAATRSRLTFALLRFRYAVSVAALFVDCWRLALLELVLQPRATYADHSEPLTVLLYHLRHACRRLLREPGFTSAAVLTLALGVGANVAVFAVVETVLLRPLPYANADRVVVIEHRDRRTGIGNEFIGLGDYVDIAARQTVFDAFGAFGFGQGEVTLNGDAHRVRVLQPTAQALTALGFRPFLGRSLSPDDQRQGATPVALLGYEFWKSRFAGDSSAVGRTISTGQLERQIVGVAPPGFSFPPNGATDVIMSWTSMPTAAPVQRKARSSAVVARLAPGQSAESATRELAEIARQLGVEHPESNLGTTFRATPIRDYLVGPTKRHLWLMLGAVTMVLLIACANVANLLLARSLGRSREIAVRVALGAGRGRLTLQLLAESLVLAAVSAIAGVAFAHWGARLLVTLVPASVRVAGLDAVHTNGVVLAFALALTIGTTLIFGLVSAAPLRSGNAQALFASARAPTSRLTRRATSGVVVAEMAFAVVLLAGAGLVLRTFAGLIAIDPGFRSDNVVKLEIAIPGETYNAAESRAAFYRQAFERIRALPTVRDVGAAVVTPLTGNTWTTRLERRDAPPVVGERPPDVGFQSASGGYFTALGIPLVAGRYFDEGDRPGARAVVIVSDALARSHFPNENAVGKVVRSGDGFAEIVGVVGSIRRAALRDEPSADMYFPFERNPPNQATLFVRTSVDPIAALPAIEKAIRDLEARTVFSKIETMDNVVTESLRDTRLLLWLLSLFAIAALLLAAVGIYGVMAYTVRQRTREIGTRLALGASASGILMMVVRQGLTLVAIGGLVGIGIGLAATRALAPALFGVSNADPTVFLVAALVLGVTATVACYLPARRAAAVDPVRTLSDN